jgi:L-asparaginase
MVFTGGTISMRVRPGRGAVPAMSGEELIAAVPTLRNHVEPTVVDFDRLPGPHWTTVRMVDLARLLDERLGGGIYHGAVVTHGTDTLEETAFFLDLTLSTDAPVVLTGAMRTPDALLWDGPANLVAAAQVASSPWAVGRGTLVVFDGSVHSARRVTKSHTDAFSSFASEDGGVVGVVDEVTGFRPGFAERERLRVSVDRLEPAVVIVPAAVGCDDGLLRHAMASQARGIVIEALGQGNVPPAMMPAVREAGDGGVPVVVASRCHRGQTAPQYGYEGGGRTLLEAGAIFSGGLSAAKARILLMVLLGSGWSTSRIRDAFEGAHSSEPPGC